MIDETQYFAIRERLLKSPQTIANLEKQYMSILEAVIRPVAPRIARDFDTAIDLLPFWVNYPPIQRGRAPTGTSVPWLEVGQSAIGFNIVRALSLSDHTITFPGLPAGADVRFMTSDAFVHLDVKVTGPNDRADEIVASHNQISGDGLYWQNGVVNSSVLVTGQRASMDFQPELPPFYVLNGTVLLCLTYFLKGVYTVTQLGKQPLAYMELVCVPNGLLTFDGPRYIDKPGLFIPGKDERAHRRKRTRVRLGPLAQIASWRRITLWRCP